MGCSMDNFHDCTTTFMDDTTLITVCFSFCICKRGSFTFQDALRSLVQRDIEEFTAGMIIKLHY